MITVHAGVLTGRGWGGAKQPTFSLEELKPQPPYVSWGGQVSHPGSEKTQIRLASIKLLLILCEPSPMALFVGYLVLFDCIALYCVICLESL